MGIPKYQDILMLHLKGVSNVKVSQITKSSRTTVIRAVLECDKLGLKLSQVEKMTDKELKAALYPRAVAEKENIPDVEYLDQEMKGDKDVTLKLLWKEYVEDCKEKKIAPLMYSQFCHHYQQFAIVDKVSGHIERVSGFSTEVDWGGTVMHWQDERTGEIMDAYLFVACLSFSRYTYCEAFSDEQTASWIAAHVHMYEFFHGSTKITICDNLKAGVVKHVKGETKINRTYQELARHYGTIISPAAVYSPKGKPNTEDSVGIIANQIIAALRHVTFCSLEELNQAIRERLEVINSTPFQKREGSRKMLFEQVECNDLQPLPTTPFEMAEWFTDLSVQFNYHVQVCKHFHYSVPYQNIGKKVSVRVTLSVVEIFLENVRIATHVRNYDRRCSYRTDPSHMPTAQQEASMRWNERRFVSWAEKIGPNTCKVVCSVINSRPVIQQSYPACLALLNLAKSYGDESLEYTCSLVFEGGFSPTLTNVKNLLAAHSSSKKETEDNPKPAPAKGFVRQHSYFQDSVLREVHHD